MFLNSDYLANFISNQQPETMKRFKTYEETYCDVKWFLRYMGAEVEGQCKWYIWSDDVDLDRHNDTLWYDKECAILTARTAIFVSKYGYPK